MSKQQFIIQFKLACTQYLTTVGIGLLRAYGRSIGVAQATMMSKNELVEKIVAVLAGEIEPQPLSKRGAPLKNDYVAPEILKNIETFRTRYLEADEEKMPKLEEAQLVFMEEYRKFLNGRGPAPILTFRSNDDDPDWDTNSNKTVYRGQLHTFDGYSMLLPLDCIDNNEKIIMPVELIRSHDLREGDVVACHATKGSQALVVREVLSVNEMTVGSVKRGDFDTKEVCFPKEKLNFCESPITDVAVSRYIDWVLPVYKGQRSLILSDPKAGKTSLVYEMLKIIRSHRTVPNVFVLLNAQTPEFVSQFRKVAPKEHFIFTTYDDEPERQVFAAEFLLRRAKRYAESGKNVLFFVDSFNALARAYNDTDASAGGKVLAGGLESKTLQFLKKYFGTARCFEKGGSITMIGTLNENTGNPADDLISAELRALANHQIALSVALSMQRVYPAINLSQSRFDEGFAPRGKERDLYNFLVNQFLPIHGEKTLLRLLSELDDYDRFLRKIYSMVK